MKISTDTLFHPATYQTGERFVGYFLPSEEDDGCYKLYDQDSENAIAHVSFTYIPEKSLLFIDDMEHYSRRANRYKGIGVLLHEFIIYQASLLSRPPVIQLAVAFNSYGFHYRFGFRFLREEHNALMQNLIEAKLERSSSQLSSFPCSMLLPQALLLEKLAFYQRRKAPTLLLFRPMAKQGKEDITSSLLTIQLCVSSS